jgi:hypothetical protein
LALTVPAKAPVVLSVETSAVSTTAFNLLVTGYATARSLAKLDLQFTARPGSILTNSQLSLDLTSLSGTWYRGSVSQNFGSLFTATIPIALQGIPASTPPKPLSDFLESVAVTLSSDLGRSNAMTTAVP